MQSFATSSHPWPVSYPLHFSTTVYPQLTSGAIWAPFSLLMSIEGQSSRFGEQQNLLKPKRTEAIKPVSVSPGVGSEIDHAIKQTIIYVGELPSVPSEAGLLRNTSLLLLSSQ